MLVCARVCVCGCGEFVLVCVCVCVCVLPWVGVGLFLVQFELFNVQCSIGSWVLTETETEKKAPEQNQM